MAIFDFNPSTRMLIEQIQASRQSISSGQISFFGSRVDRQFSPIRFWAEWIIQALLLAMPFVAIAAIVTLDFVSG